MIKEIMSSSNPYIKELNKLNNKKYRKQNNQFLIEGYHLVEEAYQNNILKTILFVNDEDVLNYKNVELIRVNQDIIDKLSEATTPQPIIGVCIIKEQIIDYSEVKHVLILDNINDPGNLGTLIRCSLGFNIDLVILSKDSVDIYNPKVLRATQGSIFKIKFDYADLLEKIKVLKDKNIHVIGTSLKTNSSLSKLKGIEKYAIVLGNEANGVRDEILEACDSLCKIEINNKLESLNVGIAGAIMMYEMNNF